MKGKVFGILMVVVLIVGAAGVYVTDPLLVLGLLPDDPLLLLFEKDEALTFEGALAIAKRLDKIGDQLETPPLPADASDLFWVMVEIAPYYHYENIAQGDLRLPSIHWSYFPEDGNFHTLGRCRVGSEPDVAINVRFANPWSSWFGKSSMFATIVHELGHAQGIYFWGDPLLEPATQLATLEVLAAMGRDGNLWALPSFVRELQGYATDYAWSLALKQDRMDEFRKALFEMGDSIYSESKFERAMAHWAGNMDQLKYILESYGEMPYTLVVGALNAPAYQSIELISLPNRIHRLNADDTAWLVQHLYSMARAHPELMAKYEERQ